MKPQEQSDGKGTQGKECGKGHGASTPSPRYHPYSTSMCSATWELSEPHTFGIFIQASSWRHDGLLTQFSAHLSTLENKEWGRKAWAGLSGDLPPSRSPPRVTSLEQKVSLSLSKLQGIRSSVSGTGVNGQILAGNTAETNIYISYYFTGT